MAEIVLGLGTSHSPQVSQDPKWWSEQGLLDQKRTPYEALLRTRAAWMDGELEPSVWAEKHQSVQTGHRGAVCCAEKRETGCRLVDRR